MFSIINTTEFLKSTDLVNLTGWYQLMLNSILTNLMLRDVFMLRKNISWVLGPPQCGLLYTIQNLSMSTGSYFDIPENIVICMLDVATVLYMTFHHCLDMQCTNL